MLDVRGTASAVRGGSATASEVVASALDRIDAANDTLNAFVHLDQNAALAAARDIDRRLAAGDDVGPLAGVPFGVKDLEDCAGMPTRSGSLLFADAPLARVDSPHVARLRAAGAVAVGKTATPEFGLDSATHSRLYGTTRNPWDLERTPGGSSGGSAAAVAAALVPFATATDGGGSTRGPAANCGLVGLKPTHGLIGLTRASDRSVSGALTADVLGTCRLLDVMAGPTRGDRTSLLQRPLGSFEHLAETLDVRGLRAAWTADLGHAVVQAEVATACESAALRLVEAAGLELVDRRVTTISAFPSWVQQALVGLRGELELDGLWPARRDDLTEQVRELLDDVTVDCASVARARREARQVEADLADAFTDVDVLLTPTSACLPWAAGGRYPREIDGIDASTTGPDALMMVANACWLPAISMPAGLSRNGLPIGLQIMAPRGRDAVLLRLARIGEQTSPWPLHAPPMAVP
ncbi:MAG: amidase [Actinobacteria bacterium]|nr:amidase [Actinomycetota bacterium]